ncbi:MAG: DegV family protein [Erysipelotrichaceae bacterium]|nr:DegV family protein [Erysipelotrichaceae bacterium]
MKLITDTSTLFTPEEGKQLGITVLPLSVTINGKTYVEYIDIQPDEFVKIVRDGHVPASSQPAVGEVLEVFESSDEEMIVVSMADGLSGTYQSAVGAKNSVENSDHIHVINSKTLCGPHRYMIKKAMKMKNEGASVQEILDEMMHLSESHLSFLIPSDFDFLSRGGRLTPIAAKIAGLIKIVPIMTQTSDGKRLEAAGVKRTMKKAVEECISQFKKFGVDKNYLITVSHADVKENAEKVLHQVHEAFPETEIELIDLSCAFITQGGPGCIAIQTIKK